jgi:putative SOS response-associated peptidase YedK
MCGRITLATPAEDIAEYFDLADWPQLAARYNIAPTQAVAVIRYNVRSNHRELSLLRWGLIPSWAEDLKIGSRLINARSETVTRKPAFREAFKTRRCLVVADGFYEWNQNGGKQPYWIHIRDQKLFALAGLWECKENPGGEIIESFTILTTESNELIRPLHDRMPVILKPDDYALWLDPATSDPDRLKALLCPYPAAAMQMEPVGTWVNKPDNEGAKCLEPPAPENEGTSLPKERRRKGEDPQQLRLF